MAYTTIKKPSDYFNTVLYTGNGSTQSITGVGFQPDWVWTKNRTTNYNHHSFDIIRTATKSLSSNLSDAENTLINTLTSFDSDGFSIGSDDNINLNSNNYASWNWLASNTTASNTDGSITSTVSANTTSGFSIVTYTGNATAGATVGHGLGVAPKMYMVKRRDAGGASWCVYHVSTGNTGALFLNDTASTSVSSTYWNDTSPTSNVFSLGGTNQAVNASGGTYIAYCFADVKGFSKFGSYTGNGSTDGTFCFTGFKPAFVLIKNSSNAGLMWNIRDNKRDTFNPNDTVLYPNSNEVENTHGDNDVDWLSNGFKMRSANGHTNASGNTYIYMAFAEEPLVGDNPATAR